MLQEFLDFILKYNVIGIAVGLIIATKVGELVKSIVEDLITPLILQPVMTRLKVDKLKDLSFRGILYGKILAMLIDFIIVAFIIFLIIKYSNIKTP